MTLIHTVRTGGRSGRPQLVPGSLACAASARRLMLAPTPFALSSTPKRVSGPLVSTVQRLAPAPM